MSDKGFIATVKIPQLGRMKRLKIYTNSADELATLENTLNQCLQLNCQVLCAEDVSISWGKDEI